MINFQLTTYCALLGILASIEHDMRQRVLMSGIADKTRGPNAVQTAAQWKIQSRVSKADISQIEGVLSLAQSVADQLELDSATDRIVRIRTRFNTAPSILTASTLEVEIRTLREAFEDEAKKRCFCYYPKAKAERLRLVPSDWKTSIEKFGPRFENSVTEAVDCYALGHNLACIFHLMRIMEDGVQKLGIRLKVPLITKQPMKLKDKTWHEILNGINPKLTAMSQRTAKAKVTYERLSATVAYLHAVKDAWRNPTMHPRADGYTDLQTLDLINHVRAFMNGLAQVV